MEPVQPPVSGLGENKRSPQLQRKSVKSPRQRLGRSAARCLSACPLPAETWGWEKPWWGLELVCLHVVGTWGWAKPWWGKEEMPGSAMVATWLCYEKVIVWGIEALWESFDVFMLLDEPKMKLKVFQLVAFIDEAVIWPD